MEDSLMKKRFLFISCEEAFHICDKSQYGEATLWEKVKLNLRFIWCHFTRAYVSKNRKLTKAMRASKVQCLNQNERDQLLNSFNQQLQNNQ